MPFAKLFVKLCGGTSSSLHYFLFQLKIGNLNEGATLWFCSFVGNNANSRNWSVSCIEMNWFPLTKMFKNLKTVGIWQMGFCSGIWIPSGQWYTNWKLVWWSVWQRIAFIATIFGELGWSWRCSAADNEEIQPPKENSCRCLSSKFIQLELMLFFWRSGFTATSGLGFSL